MLNKKIYLLLAVCLVSGSAFAQAERDERERVFRVQNSVRVGYDDNVYQTKKKDGTGFITDIINISGKLNFSSRTDMLLYWQPEFRYRFDADPNFVNYQDLYARLNHALSQRTFLRISDRFRYQDKEGQTGIITSENQNYIENDLMGALDVNLNSLSQVNLGAGYLFRTWDDENYGETRGNDFDQYTLNGSYIRELRPNTTTGMLGANYTDLEYEGSRGGYDALALFLGADHNFSPSVFGNIRAGATFSEVESKMFLSGEKETNDNTAPYLQAGLNFNPTARTSLNGSLGYSVYRAENSFYNAQDRFNLGIGLRHDLTGKISLSSAISYIHSVYDSEYARGGGGIVGDATDDYFKFSLRGSYQINRNNFVDAGYEFSNRSSDELQEYDRNRVDIGWRLRL
jgi:hypothetical protein